MSIEENKSISQDSDMRLKLNHCPQRRMLGLVSTKRTRSTLQTEVISYKGHIINFQKIINTTRKRIFKSSK